jgi:predicted phosphodiesterase
MRYGVISDVHGNLHALEAVLERLGGAGVNRFVVPGDVVGYGPRPNECVARIAALEPRVVAVAGNHDLMAIGRLPADGLGPLPRRTIEWTREALDPAARAWLEALPLTAATGDGVRVAHGSLDDPTTYVRDCAAGAAELARVGEDRVLLLGHTHHPLACARAGGTREPSGVLDLPADEGPWLLNAGSVGQPRERRPLARALVLDLERARAEFLAVEYDARATRRELRQARLPPHACHLAPGRVARLRRRLGMP